MNQRKRYCKVFNDEELAVLNLLIKWKREKRAMDEPKEEVIDVYKQERILMLSDASGREHAAQLVWIEHVEGDYYLASLRYIDPYPYRDGYTEWMIKLDKEVGFIPMFCSLYY